MRYTYALYVPLRVSLAAQRRFGMSFGARFIVEDWQRVSTLLDGVSKAFKYQRKSNF